MGPRGHGDERRPRMHALRRDQRFEPGNGRRDRHHDGPGPHRGGLPRALLPRLAHISGLAGHSDSTVDPDDRLSDRQPDRGDRGRASVRFGFRSRPRDGLDSDRLFVLPRHRRQGSDLTVQVQKAGHRHSRRLLGLDVPNFDPRWHLRRYLQRGRGVRRQRGLRGRGRGLVAPRTQAQGRPRHLRRDGCIPRFLPRDHGHGARTRRILRKRRNSGPDGRVDSGQGPRVLAVSTPTQRTAPRRRHDDGHPERDVRIRAFVGSHRSLDGRRPDALRHHLHRQPRDRLPHTAGRPQPLRRQCALWKGLGPHHTKRCTLRRPNADRSRDHHLVPAGVGRPRQRDHGW